MSVVKRKTLYFTVPGKTNTDALLKFLKEYAQTLGVNHIVVASTTGETGSRLQRFSRASMLWLSLTTLGSANRALRS